MTTRALLAKAARPNATGGDLVAAGVSSTKEALRKLNVFDAKMRKPISAPPPANRGRGGGTYPYPTKPTTGANSRTPTTPPAKKEVRILTTAPNPQSQPQPKRRRRRRRRRQRQAPPIIIRQQTPVPFAPHFQRPLIPRQAPQPRIQSHAYQQPQSQPIIQQIPIPIEQEPKNFSEQVKHNLKKHPLLYAAGALFLLIVLFKR